MMLAVLQAGETQLPFLVLGIWVLLLGIFLGFLVNSGYSDPSFLWSIPILLWLRWVDLPLSVYRTER